MVGLGMRARVRRYGLFEEDAEDGDGSGDDGGCGFDAGPDGEFFAVVGEVFLAELDHVDAFYYGADTGPGEVVLALLQHWEVQRKITYSTPMLMAIPTPIFSRSFSCNPHIRYHGSSASAKSAAAHHAALKIP